MAPSSTNYGVLRERQYCCDTRVYAYASTMSMDGNYFGMSVQSQATSSEVTISLQKLWLLLGALPTPCKNVTLFKFQVQVYLFPLYRR